MSAADSTIRAGWWRRNLRPLGALTLGLIAAAGMFATVDVLPEVQAEAAVQFVTAEENGDSVRLSAVSVGPVAGQFFPADAVAFTKPPAGSQAMWVTVDLEDAPTNCTLRLTEVGGRERTWLSAIPILNWNAPEDSPPACAYERAGEDYRLISSFALPQDASGSFTLDVVVNDFEDLVVRVARFPLTPTLAEG